MATDLRTRPPSRAWAWGTSTFPSGALALASAPATSQLALARCRHVGAPSLQPQPLASLAGRLARQGAGERVAVQACSNSPVSQGGRSSQRTPRPARPAGRFVTAEGADPAVAPRAEADARRPRGDARPPRARTDRHGPSSRAHRLVGAIDRGEQVKPTSDHWGSSRTPASGFSGEEHAPHRSAPRRSAWPLWRSARSATVTASSGRPSAGGPL